jgi:hypothetical protein
LVEQCPFKAWVAGSNPAALTRVSDDLLSLHNKLFLLFIKEISVSRRVIQQR